MVRITFICLILSGCTIFNQPINNEVKPQIGKEIIGPDGYYQFCMNTPNGVIC